MNTSAKQSMSVAAKRVYESPARDDGTRVLVDRLWPRGVSKSDAKVSRWMKEIAPSDGLRKWFGHDPKKWASFKVRFWKELHEHDELVADLLKIAHGGRLTLVFSAKDENHNNAVALKEYLLQRT
jgi:uncharacterized protein YeaO (DUF488 family)